MIMDHRAHIRAEDARRMKFLDWYYAPLAEFDLRLPYSEQNLRELLEREWYISCDMSKYIAFIIDTLNHDSSISDLLNPNNRIQSLVTRYRNGEV